MQLKPIGKRILIQKMEKEKTGLIIVDRHDEAYTAKVISIGDKSEIPAKEGDTLLLVPYSGLSPVKNSEYLIVNDNDVLGIVA